MTNVKQSAGAAKRGPRPKPDPGTQTGYRVTARRRLELGMAQTFTGAPSMQQVLDQAVDYYLAWMKQEIDGFEDAITKVVAFREKQSGVVPINSNRRPQT